MGTGLGLGATGWLMVKDLKHRPGRVFKQLLDDVTPRHDGACDIYRMFGDTVYVTALATAVASTVRF